MPQVQLLAPRAQGRRHHQVEFEDLNQDGVPALIHAVDRFQLERQCLLKTLAEHCIRTAILDYLRQLDPLPRTVRRSFDVGRMRSCAWDTTSAKAGRNGTRRSIESPNSAVSPVGSRRAGRTNLQPLRRAGVGDHPMCLMRRFEDQNPAGGACLFIGGRRHRSGISSMCADSGVQFSPPLPLVSRAPLHLTPSD